VPVYDVTVEEDGAQSFVMKRVRGRTLREIVAALARGEDVGITRHRLLAAFVQLCLAVDNAHARGVVHRDVKPENVMLGDFGEVLLLDWGIARLTAEGESDLAVDPIADTAAGGITREGSLLGTLGYMPPEQLRGEHGSLDARADVYALGCVLFELLALAPLHRGTHFADLVASTLGTPDARPSVRAPDRGVSTALDAICVRATASTREERYPSARALAEALDQVLDGDREAAARRAQAATLAEQARKSLTDRAGDLEARVNAGREAAQAIALDPDNAAARETLLASIATPPEQVPAEVVAEMDRDRVGHERVVLAQGGWTALLIKIILAIVFLTIVRIFSPMVAWGAVVCGFASAFALLLAARAANPTLLATVGIVLMCVENGIFTRWSSPYAISNMVAVATGVVLTINASRRARVPRYLMALSVVLVPGVLELIGVLRPTFLVGPTTATIAPTLGQPLPTWLMLVHFTIIAVSTGNGLFVALDRARAVDARARSQRWLLERVLGAH
jgi:serine/threonine-protein kinase